MHQRKQHRPSSRRDRIDGIPEEWPADGFSISPFSLPLEDGVFVAKPHPLDGMFGIFADSLPDGWGRLLVDRMLRANRMMAFNVLCGNRDDHSKNFTFIRTAESGWRLSPAYDLTSNSGMNGEHATTVNGKGRDITDEDMMEVARQAGIPRAKALDLIERTSDALRG